MNLNLTLTRLLNLRFCPPMSLRARHRLALVILFLAAFAARARAQNPTFIFPNSGQEDYTVPAGVTEITVKIWGAGGGGGVNSSGGAGGFVTGVLAVTPGETLQIVTGARKGVDGSGGGGSGGASPTAPGGGGGGASYIMRDWVILAGAGGGGGAGSPTSGADGGAGGGIFGINGSGTNGQGGLGGDPSTGGVEPGVFQSGGNGQNGTQRDGGGGGEGYAAGSGGLGSNSVTGFAGGGGGGSSYIGGLEKGATIAGTGATPGGSPFLYALISATGGSASQGNGGDGLVVIIPLDTRQLYILHNDILLGDGDATPAVADGTDFGSLSAANSSVAHTFTLRNGSDATITLTGTPRVVVTGPDAADFTVTLQPDAPVPADASNPSVSPTFTIAFDPTTAGLRTAVVSIASDAPNTNPFTFTIQGTGIAAPPIAAFTATPNPCAPTQTVSFNGAGSSQPDPQKSIVSWAWDFGDGATGSGVAVGHAYTHFGSYSAKLTVTDNSVPPQTATTTTQVNVTQGNLAPTANAGGPYAITAGGALLLNGTGSTDPNTAAGDSIVSYQWDIGNDGNFDAVGANPTVSWATLQSLLTTPNQYPSDPVTGLPNIAVRLRVTDTFGATGESVTTLRIYQNQAPIANAGGPYTINAGDSLVLDGGGSSDPNVLPGDSIVSYQWDIGNDGNFDAVGVNPTVSWATLQSLLTTPNQYPSDPVTGLPNVAVRLRVTDTFGATGESVATLRIHSPSTAAISFEKTAYSVDEGTETVTLSLIRTGSGEALSVTIATHDGTASVVPPFAAATAALDYVGLTGGATIVSFAPNEFTRTVTIPLLPRTGAAAAQNRRFTVTIADRPGAPSGAITTTTIQILAFDGSSPTLTVLTPGANSISAASPYQVKGTAGDARGIDRVEVSLNGAIAVPADLGASVNNASIPWSLTVEPVPGLNSLAITAYDLSGNFAGIRRSFFFDRRYVAYLTRIAPIGMDVNTVGTVAVVATPSTSSTALAAATANPQSFSIRPTTSVKVTATPKVGYVFSHWSGTPGGAVIEGNVLTFTMPVGDPAITATFVANPFLASGGAGNVFYGLLHPTGAAASCNDTEGFLTGTLTPASGAFSGKVLIGGLTQSFVATFYGDGGAFFTVGTAKLPSLIFGDRVLTLGFSGGNVQASLTKAAATTSAGVANRGIYSATNKVGSAFLNSTAKGFYTVSLPATAQVPAIDAATYPQGDGIATISVTDLGMVTVAGTLADGSAVTASSALIAGNGCPVFAQLMTPGAAATVKGGSIGGLLAFDPTAADSDVTASSSLLWIRPAAVGASAAANLYTAGWPNGIRVNAMGALYSVTANAQATLGLSAPNAVTGNGQLMFTDGKLAAPVLKTTFNIVTNTVTKIPPTDTSYTLTLAPTLGTFSGTFTPNWLSPATAKPAYKGILIQKGASKGGFGYFISNAVGDTDPESGGVTLSGP